LVLLWRLRQEDGEFKASLGYTEFPDSNKTKKENKQNPTHTKVKSFKGLHKSNTNYIPSPRLYTLWEEGLGLVHLCLPSF
jgi:hypothetical protein